MIFPVSPRVPLSNSPLVKREPTARRDLFESSNCDFEDERKWRTPLSQKVSASKPGNVNKEANRMRAHQHISDDGILAKRPKVEKDEPPTKSFPAGAESDVSSEMRNELINDNTKYADTFGMFGLTAQDLEDMKNDDDENYWDDGAVQKVNYFERLPSDIVENILCRLPFVDLCLNVNHVCLAWNDLISTKEVHGRRYHN